MTTQSEKAASMDAATILAVPLDEPEVLFGASPSGLPDVFKTLVRRWHPDRCSDLAAGAVSSHLIALHGVARARAASGEWRRPGVLTLLSIDGRSYELHYRRRRSFELGEIHVGRSAIAFSLRRDADDFAERAIATIGAIGYRDADWADAFAARMPRLLAHVQTRERTVLVLAKTPDQVLLADLLGYMGGRLEPRHVAWIVSELESLATFLEQGPGLINAGLSPETILVSPERHTVTLVGGWWYAAARGDTLVGVSQRVENGVPPVSLGDGQATPALALDLIRLVAAEALGARSPLALGGVADLPPTIADFLATPVPAEAAADYAAWERARDAAWPRAFTPFPVDPDEVTPPL